MLFRSGFHTGEKETGSFCDPWSEARIFHRREEPGERCSLLAINKFCFFQSLSLRALKEERALDRETGANSPPRQPPPSCRAFAPQLDGNQRARLSASTHFEKKGREGAMKPLRRAHLADIHRPNSKRKRKEEKTKIGRQRSHVLDLFPLLFNIIKNYFTRPSKSGAPGARSRPASPTVSRRSS